MRAYAPRFGGEIELWGLTGLLHDLDYERYPDLSDGHPRYAVQELSARGYPEALVRAVASHADFMGVPRESEMTAKSVKKKLKQPSFAAAVNREELLAGAADLGVDFDEHLSIVIEALAAQRDDLVPARANS